MSITFVANKEIRGSHVVSLFIKELNLYRGRYCRVNIFTPIRPCTYCFSNPNFSLCNDCVYEAFARKCPNILS